MTALECVLLGERAPAAVAGVPDRWSASTPCGESANVPKWSAFDDMDPDDDDDPFDDDDDDDDDDDFFADDDDDDDIDDDDDDDDDDFDLEDDLIDDDGISVSIVSR